jgi:hypothetical protein
MFGFGSEYEGLAFWLPLVWAGLLALLFPPGSWHRCVTRAPLE